MGNSQGIGTFTEDNIEASIEALNDDVDGEEFVGNSQARGIFTDDDVDGEEFVGNSQERGIFTDEIIQAGIEASIDALNDVLDWEEVAGLKKKKRQKKSSSAHPIRNRGYALQEMQRLTGSEFRKMFRLSRETFYWLLPQLDLESKSIVPNRKHITAETKLAIALRFLAGGSYLDICFAFGVAFGTIFKDDGVLWRTLDAIDRVLQIGLPLNDPAKLREISQGFSEWCHGRMQGCVMAMDGWVCKVEQPAAKGAPENIMCYRNRKGVWGLVVFAGCDHKCRFLMMACNCPGSTNDCLAWKLTNVKNDIVDKGRLPKEYYFICDEALECTEEVLVPYGGTGLEEKKDTFNYHLSAMRQCIERAFGLLVRRWGIFWRPLRTKMHRWTTIIHVCAKLHNLCIDREGGVGVEGDIEVMEEDMLIDDVTQPLTNDFFIENEGYVGSHQHSARRINLTEVLHAAGYKRPSHSRHSRAGHGDDLS